MKLLELVVALALSAILLLVMDTLYSMLWQTRASIEHTQDILHARQLPDQLFSRLLLHAGHLGCRAVSDGIIIKTPESFPRDFFLHQGKAVLLQHNELWVHETLAHQIVWEHPIEQGSRITPTALAPYSDWLLISDCTSAELVRVGGQVIQSYQAPTYIASVTVVRWYLKEARLYRQQVYPHQPAEPVLDDVNFWQWDQTQKLMVLKWGVTPEGDEFVFELGNS